MKLCHLWIRVTGDHNVKWNKLDLQREALPDSFSYAGSRFGRKKGRQREKGKRENEWHENRATERGQGGGNQKMKEIAHTRFMYENVAMYHTALLN